MEKVFLVTSIVLVILLLPDASVAVPRAQTVRIMCGSQPENNATIYVPNFVATMENISTQIRTSTVLPQCFPMNGGRIFLDRCFMRAENYSFFHEYTGPNDQTICGNTTRRDSAFGDSARRAVSQTVSDAMKNNGYARGQVVVSEMANVSAYVLANCWQTLNASACRACLENASSSISRCLPWSDSRVLNTGCFLRYSDTDFLNPIPANGSPTDSSKGKSLNWERRFEIIIGTAEGLVYLHENTTTRIIHRDIKASNILLDSRLRAKIADFGLARSFQEDKSHISTAIAGTLGYMAPEYLAHGQLTEKADVYSFGVLLLEIVSGRQNNRSKTAEYTDSLVTIAWTHFQERTIEELLDPNLMLQHNYQNANTNTEILRVIHVGLLCCQEIPSLRPVMSRALQMLVKKEERLPSPTNPPFMDEKTMELNDVSYDQSNSHQHGNGGSVANISHSIFFPR